MTIQPFLKPEGKRHTWKCYYSMCQLRHLGLFAAMLTWQDHAQRESKVFLHLDVFCNLFLNSTDEAQILTAPHHNNNTKTPEINHGFTFYSTY